MKYELYKSTHVANYFLLSGLSRFQMIGLQISVVSILVTAFSSCGTSSTRNTKRQTSLSQSFGVSTDEVVTEVPTPISSPVGTESSVAAPFQIPIKSLGNSSLSFNVKVTKNLKIRFSPKISTQKTVSTNMISHYSKLGVMITVNDKSQDTGVLDNGLLGGQAQVSAVLDFSDAIGSSDQEREVKVTIETPVTDYFCLKSYWSACPYSKAIEPLSNLPWNAIISVETDKTGPV